MQRELKFRGEKLKHFIYLEVYRFRNPVRCKDLLPILEHKTGASPPTIFRLLNELVKEEKLKKINSLNHGSHTYYFKND